MSIYGGLGWYIHLNKKNYYKYGINPIHLNPSIGLGASIRQQKEDLLDFLRFLKRDKIDAEKIERFLQGVQGYNSNESMISYKDFSTYGKSVKESEDLFTSLVRERLGAELNITKDISILKTEFDEKLSTYKAAENTRQTQKRSIRKILENLQRVINQTQNLLQKGQLSKKEANKIINQANSYTNQLMSVIQTGGLDEDVSEYKRILQYSGKNKNLIEKINQFIKSYSYRPKKKQLGDAAELYVAFALLALNEKKTNTAKQITKEFIDKTIIGSKGQNLTIQMSSLFSEDEIKNLAKDFNWSVGDQKGQLKTSSTGTVDIYINEPSLNEEFNAGQGIRASIKNYSNSNKIGILNGASMISLLSTFELPFANHYLNLMNQEALGELQAIPKNAEEAFNLSTGYRGLAGFRGKGTQLADTANLFVANVGGKIQVYPISSILNQINNNINLIHIRIDGKLSKNSAKRVDDTPPRAAAKTRILNVLKNMHAIKVSASISLNQLK